LDGLQRQRFAHAIGSTGYQCAATVLPRSGTVSKKGVEIGQKRSLTAPGIPLYCARNVEKRFASR
jgi:hypothetical protein